MKKVLRRDAKTLRHKDGFWWALYPELKKPGQKQSPKLSLCNDPEKKIPLELLSQWRIEGKPQVERRLGLRDDNPFKLSEMIGKYLNYKRTAQKPFKQNTDIYVQRSLRFLLDSVGDIDLKNWGEKPESRFLNYLRSRGVTGTAHITHVQGFLNYIWKRQVIPGFSYWKLEKWEAPDFDIEIFTQDELDFYKKKIFEHENVNWRRAWMAAYFAFLRCGEIWSLRTQDIDFKANKIKITPTPELDWTPKKEILRGVPMHEELADFLKKDLTENRRFWFLERTTKRALFYNPDHPFRNAFSSAHGLSTAFLRLRDQQWKWEVKKDMLQALRRTTITKLVERRYAIKDVMKWCGHKTMSTTEKYYLWVDRNTTDGALDF